MDRISTLSRSALLLVAVSGLTTPLPAEDQPIFPDLQVDAGVNFGDPVGGDFDRDGKPDIVLPPCWYSCPGFAFLKGTGHGDFITIELNLQVNFPQSPARAVDLDGDGSLDLVFGRGIPGPVPLQAPSGEVGVALGVGDGSFQQAFYYEAYAADGTLPTVADLNGDGRMDVASFHPFAAGVTVLLGRGDGTLRAIEGITAPGTVHALAAGDLDRDGRDDLLVAVPGSGSVFIHLGRGDGSLAAAGNVAAMAYALHAVDTDDDGDTDLVASHRTGPTDDLLVFRNDGNAGFGAPLLVPLGRQVRELASGDLNGAPYVDLLVGLSAPAPGANLRSDLLVLLGRSDGLFDRAQEIRAGGPGQAVNVMDVDLDGRQDLVSLSTLSRKVTVLHGQGDGSFLSQDQLVDGSRPNVVVAADLNGDGRPDLAAVNAGSQDLAVLLGQPTGGFASAPRIAFGEAPVGLAVADLNADGMQDLAVTTSVSGANPPRGGVFFLSGRGDGTFEAPVRVTAGGPGGPIIATDLDEDDHIDLVYGESIFLYLLAGNGDGSFDPKVLMTSFPTPATSLAPADFDGDDHTDLGVCAYPAIRVLLGDGQGGISPAPSPSPTLRCKALATGDFDTDGRIDLGVAEVPSENNRFQGRGMAVFSGAGDGTFALTWLAGTLLNASGAAVADFDADGIDDLAVTGMGDTGVAVLISRGDRTFEATLIFATDIRPIGLAAADLDKDGRQDLVVANDSVTGGLSILLNSGPRLDEDGDGIANRFDSCTDSDGDSLGNRGFRSNTCPMDLCPSVFDPAQSDRDGDDIGDECDPCSGDPLNDFDGDGLCGDVDFCPERSNPGHPDADGDGIPDACDNCRIVPKIDQADGNDDGSGDACQPKVSILSIREDGGEALEVTAAIGDPQGDTLQTRIEIREEARSLFVPNFIDGPFTCDRGYQLGGIGQGFIYVYPGQPRLADLDWALADTVGQVCQDAEPDYWFAPIPCAAAGGSTYFDLVVDLRQAASTGSSICIRPYQSHTGGYDLFPLSAGADGLNATIVSQQLVGVGESPSGLPAAFDISNLHPYRDHILTITVYDGTAVPVGASLPFMYRSERLMVFNTPPHAVVVAPPMAECAAAYGAIVTLDGSASTDADSSPGTNDAIADFTWFENPGTPDERLLGSGETIDVMLALGTHVLSVTVTDFEGASDRAAFVVTVRDMSPPTLRLHTDPGTLWPPNHEMQPVWIWWEAEDACDPSVDVRLVSVASSEADDGPGTADGATTGDVEGADIGTPDMALLLRAERDGRGAGRIYTLTYRAADQGGNTTPALATVLVPHDLGHGPEPLLMRLERGAGEAAAHLFWPAVPDAVGYDVISGDLESLRVSNGRIDLGTVRVLARSTPATSLDEPAVTPASGKGFFYLIQQRTGAGPAGYGTESVPWPRVPESCDGGCP